MSVLRVSAAGAKSAVGTGFRKFTGTSGGTSDESAGSLHIWQWSATKAKEKGNGVLVAILFAVAVLIAVRAVGFQAGKKIAGSYSQNPSFDKTDVKSEEIKEEDIKEAIKDLNLTDLLSQNKAVMIEDEVGGRTIAIVYYGADSHILTWLTGEKTEFCADFRFYRIYGKYYRH